MSVFRHSIGTHAFVTLGKEIIRVDFAPGGNARKVLSAIYVTCTGSDAPQRRSRAFWWSERRAKTSANLFPANGREVTATSAACGCRKRSRTSSSPTEPDAPITATLVSL